MTIVGFNYTKMSAQKKSAPKGELKINLSLKIKDVKEAKIGAGSNKGLTYTFEFSTKYTPDFGSIVLEGNVLDLQEKATVDKVLKQWKKDKKLDQEQLLPIYNNALNRCSIQAIILSKEMGLPSPVPLPRKGK